MCENMCGVLTVLTPSGTQVGKHRRHTVSQKVKVRELGCKIQEHISAGNQLFEYSNICLSRRYSKYCSDRRVR